MAKVRSVSSRLLYTPLTLVFVAGSGKSVLWFVISCDYFLRPLTIT
jgi:hypothetical protein